MFPRKATAKRAAPRELPPVTHDGVRYFAVCEGVGGAEFSCAVVARKSGADEPLWRTILYRVRYDKNKETDVQDVWPRSLTIEGGDVVVIDEKDARFRVDLKSGRLKNPEKRKTR